MKKKIFLTGLIATTALTLVGCSGTSPTTSGFSNIEINGAPTWDTQNIDFTGWGSDKEDYISTDAIGDSYASLKTEDGSCNLYIENYYDESWKEGRGAEFNSYSLMFDRMNSGVVNISGEPNTVNINNITFAQSTFASDDISRPNQVNDADKSSKQKIAVRVFDNLIEIPGMEGTEGSGIFGSDANKGLPVLALNIVCDSKTDDKVIETLWADAIERLKINTTPNSEDANNETTTYEEGEPLVDENGEPLISEEDIVVMDEDPEIGDQLPEEYETQEEVIVDEQ